MREVNINIQQLAWSHFLDTARIKIKETTLSISSITPIVKTDPKRSRKTYLWYKSSAYMSFQIDASSIERESNFTYENA